MLFNIVDDQITEHFTLREFANSKDGNAIIINADTVLFWHCLEVFRQWYNRPMNITSGYRTVAFNREVGGASNSYHPKGLAADFLLPSDYYRMDPARRNIFITNIKHKWYEICRAEGKQGSVIIYDGWLHLSFWPYQYFEDKRTR